MLSDLVASSIEPEIIRLLHAADAALGGVQSRLEEQFHSGDSALVFAAALQLKALEAWRPALMDIVATLSLRASAPPHAPLPHGH